jgi:hypothetical protein
MSISFTDMSVPYHWHDEFSPVPCRVNLGVMPTDAERWRFLADHGLTLHTDGGDYGYMVHWCRTAGPGQPPKFYPVANGTTADEAIDRAMERYYRKHAPRVGQREISRAGVVWLAVKGWVD